jgi:hypothetical protein
MPLPLSSPPPGQCIPAQEVWQTLSQPQQAHLFQQLVRVCCQLVQGNLPPQEVSDEQP